MLSRDEQALDMARVICPEAGTRKCVDGKCSRLLHCPARISIFEALIDAGYGDVTEYKAEIERLNEELKKPQEQFVQDDEDREEEIEDRILDEKIKLLNYVKKQAIWAHMPDVLSLDDVIEYGMFVGAIDELIKGLEFKRDFKVCKDFPKEKVVTEVEESDTDQAGSDK